MAVGNVIKFGWNKAAFATRMAAVSAAYGKDWRQALRHAGAVMVRIAINMTPPIANGRWNPNARRKSKDDQRAGIGAVLRDFAATNKPVTDQEWFRHKGSAIPLDTLQHSGAIKKFLEGKSKQAVLLRDKFLEKFPKAIGVLKQPSITHHNSQRASRGRVRRRPHFYFITSFPKWAAAARKLASGVGYACSGWRTAADRLGVKYPDWIAKHHAGGRYQEMLRGIQPRIAATNAVPWIGSAVIGGEPAATRIPREAERHAMKTLRREMAVAGRRRQGMGKAQAVAMRNVPLEIS